jgi:hypothetical protein
MTKTNRRRRELQEEHRSYGYHPPNPFIYTPSPSWTYRAPLVTLPGKVPHRICRGKT